MYYTRLHAEDSPTTHNSLSTIIDSGKLVVYVVRKKPLAAID